MSYIIDTNFKIPEQVVLNFIKSSYKYFKLCPIGSESDKEALNLIYYYTYLKFNKYYNYRYELSTIKEIDSIELINKKETKVITKKNQSAIPVCEFTLKLKNKKQKIFNVRIKQGENNYHSMFIN